MTALQRTRREQYFDMGTPGKIAVTSSGLLKMRGLDEFLGAPIRRAPMWTRPKDIRAVAGWGTKKSGARAEKIAGRLGVPVLHLEDGFLRSMRPGRTSRSYSLVKDYSGIYYDSTRPSDLENLLNGDRDLLDGVSADVERARQLIVSHRLSKYNHAPALPPDRLRKGDLQRVLVVDQTMGDQSVLKGAATAETFQEMLDAALSENPDATVYVKTHPEVSLGAKRGYLSGQKDSDRLVLLRDSVNPIDLILEMNRIYTVTSTMGFEALLAGKNVTCFGIPWYSGWGATDDRRACRRRQTVRTTNELLAAAYFHYTIYLDPQTQRIGTIFDLIEWLIQEKAALNKDEARR